MDWRARNTTLSPILKRCPPPVCSLRLHFEEIAKNACFCTLACRIVCFRLHVAAGMARADDDEKPAAKSVRPEEKGLASEVTTPGRDRGGWAAYRIQRGGGHHHSGIKRYPGCATRHRWQAATRIASLRAAEPKEPKDASPTARMSYVAYFKKDSGPEERRADVLL